MVCSRDHTVPSEKSVDQQGLPLLRRMRDALAQGDTSEKKSSQPEQDHGQNKCWQADPKERFTDQFLIRLFTLKEEAACNAPEEAYSVTGQYGDQDPPAVRRTCRCHAELYVSGHDHDACEDPQHFKRELPLFAGFIGLSGIFHIVSSCLCIRNI